MRSILIINPNSTEQMTNGLKPLVDALQFKDVNQHHSSPTTQQLTAASRPYTSTLLRPLVQKASTTKMMPKTL